MGYVALSYAKSSIAMHMRARVGCRAFAERGQRDIGVISLAHRFVCELGAFLTNDKHLGSAERSERQVFKNQTRTRVPEALWRIRKVVEVCS